MDETCFDWPPPRKARIEIIPLIDVIFFLLATFVLFTLSLEKIGAIEASLPKVPPPHAPSPPVDRTVYLQASDEGTFYWKVGREGEPELLSLSEIRPRLQSHARAEREPRVMIRGDNGARFGAAVMLLDEVQLAGIQQVAVETVVSKPGQ